MRATSSPLFRAFVFGVLLLIFAAARMATAEDAKDDSVNAVREDHSRGSRQSARGGASEEANSEISAEDEALKRRSDIAFAEWIARIEGSWASEDETFKMEIKGNIVRFESTGRWWPLLNGRRDWLKQGARLEIAGQEFWFKAFDYEPDSAWLYGPEIANVGYALRLSRIDPPVATQKSTKTAEQRRHWRTRYHPLPVPGRIWRVATNLNQNRRGAPGSGSQAFDVVPEAGFGGIATSGQRATIPPW